MIKSITIIIGKNQAFFLKGGKITRDGKETKVTVTKISVWGERIAISFSDKTKNVYKGFKYIYTK